MNKYTLGFEVYWNEKANEILKTKRYIIKPYDKTYLYFYRISIYKETDSGSNMSDCFLYTPAYNKWSEYNPTSWTLEMFRAVYEFNIEIDKSEANFLLNLSPKQICKLESINNKNPMKYIYNLKEKHPEHFL